ncbi:hypothetical protein, partial [Parabacteroides distasonis]|uniref:hypothetical protein n=1 Tax=Parabacteroides distasonis TaxID=823 RepID=UPI00232DEAB4
IWIKPITDNKHSHYYNIFNKVPPELRVFVTILIIGEQKYTIFFSRSLLEIKASTRKLCGLAVTDLIVVS